MTEFASTAVLIMLRQQVGSNVQCAWSEGDNHYSFATARHEHGWYNGTGWGWSAEPKPCKPECETQFPGIPRVEFPPVVPVPFEAPEPALSRVMHAKPVNGVHECCGQNVGTLWPLDWTTNPNLVTCPGPRLGIPALVHLPSVEIFPGSPRVYPCCSQRAGTGDLVSPNMVEVTCPGRGVVGDFLIAAGAEPPSVTHIAGLRVDVGTRVRQLCAWCGVVLVEGDRVPPGRYSVDDVIEVEVKNYTQGEMVRVSSDDQVILNGWLLPEDSCTEVKE